MLVVPKEATPPTRHAGVLVANRKGVPSIWGVSPDLERELGIREGDALLTVRDLPAPSLGSFGVNFLLRARDGQEKVRVRVAGADGRPRVLALPPVQEAI